MAAVLLTIAYDGRHFAGFAPQPGQRTIGGELLGAIQAVDPGVREQRGASRTDAGVHARGQLVAFDPTKTISTRGWVLAINQHLPEEIAVRRAALVDDGFSPRFANQGKRYRYSILRDSVRDPFLDGRVWRVQGLAKPGALERAREEAQDALGTHDFAAFRSSADQRTNTERTLRAIDVTVDPADDRIVRIDVQGDAFLHNMVRILVGTIADVAIGRRPKGAILRALASGNRREAGITAPPDGLCLERVFLPNEGSDPWPPVGETQGAEGSAGGTEEGS